ncbi:Hsp70 family protein [Actinoplanes sp. NPDC049596]|uniref:Hsp70 family protein n=1 Tax=unclassified Actinoplanes TaxID=2626549 RepID=UPI00341B5E7B
MTDGYVLGVDLGTSHTVAMLRRPDGRTRPLLFDGRPLLPSAVFLDPTGRLHVGADALRLGQADPGRLEPHPKRHVDQDTVMLGDGATVGVADLLAALLEAVAREAVATAGFLPPAVITYPAAWGARRRAVLTHALDKAGWPPDTLGQPSDTALVPEPVAAARYFAEVLRRPLPDKSALAVFDFGAGTLDIAVVRRDATTFAVAASGGADDLGRLDIDAALVEHLGKSLSGAEPAAWQALTEPVTLAQWRARRQFWEDVRGAKEMLSRSSFAPVPVPGVEQAVHLTRDELEAAADPLIRRAVAEAATVIAAAGLTPADLAGLFLVGGSSRVPLVARLLHSELGIAPTVLEQPELPVAEGATLRHAPTTATPPPLTDTHATSPTDPATAPSPAGSPSSPSPAGSAHSGPSAQAAPSPWASPLSAADKTDEREYVEAVDPWAAGEAAAIAAGHLAPGSPTSSAPAPGSPAGTQPGSPTSSAAAPGSPEPAPEAPWQPPTPPPAASPDPAAKSRRRTWTIAGAAALALLLAGGSALAWTLWPRHPSLDYHPLSELQHVPPVVEIGSAWSDAAVRGDRVYFASTNYDNGDLGVVALDAGEKSAAWSHRETGVAQRWQEMVALPDGVALFSDTDSSKGTSELVILDAGRGDKRWQRTLGRDDVVYFAGDRAIVADRQGRRLLGLKLDDGSEAWAQPDPGESTSPTAVHLVTTPADLDGPAGLTGRPFDADPGDDPRLVQITPDHSVRVLNANSGKIIASRANVADTDDDVVAHNGRLIVREDEDADRIVTYQLDQLGEPDVTYTAPTATAKLGGLTPCGDDRVCAIESTGYGDENATVIALDVAKGGKLWSRKAAKAETLVPVGEAVLARSTTPETTLIDAAGEQVGTGKFDAVRLDAANILEFSKPLVGYVDDPAVAGRHLGDDPVQLGPLQGVRTSTCAWNTSVLACVADKDFIVTRFAE